MNKRVRFDFEIDFSNDRFHLQRHTAQIQGCWNLSRASLCETAVGGTHRDRRQHRPTQVDQSAY